MDLTQLANLGEFIGGVGSVIGGIAVLVTLIYLALQIRHNTRVAASSMHYQMLSITNEHFKLTTNNPELSEIVRRGNGDPDTLTEDEWERFREFFLHAIRDLGSRLRQPSGRYGLG